MTVRLGRGTCDALQPALRREWLVTNGLGGYASGTVAGIASRRYHGLLVAALDPPVGRTVLVGALVEWATVGPERAALHAHEYADGTIDQHGYRRLESVVLEGSMPVFSYAFGETIVEKRIWMVHGANTTFIRYAVSRGNQAVTLELTPLVCHRDHHTLGHEADGAPAIAAGDRPAGGSFVVRPAGGGRSLMIAAAGGTAAMDGRWFRSFRHREETARGLDDLSDLYAVGTLSRRIEPGSSWTLVLSAEDEPDLDAEAELARERRRTADLVAAAGAGEASSFVRDLVVAADQFIVERRIPVSGGSPEIGRTVIAGYPWFNDWGRDTLIALPGLTLATGRHEDGATILRSFARFIRDGLVPNNFPDLVDEEPAYNTADASLWYPVAVRATELASADHRLVDDLLPTLVSILEQHLAGTRFGIGLDPADGLLRAGADGVQLTWMDARVDDRVVTPRRGKPVEVQALWINALRLVASWLAERGDAGGAGARFAAVADQATASFLGRFWRPELGWLADVVDGPDGDDLALRPNQLLALSLPHPLISGDPARRILEAAGTAFLTSIGLRSLAPTDPAYRPSYQGDQRTRDGAYHQGTVWAWLIGPYVDAILRTSGDRDLARSVLAPFEAHLADAGLGSISEIAEPEPAHIPRGCIAQAWSVAEVLRVRRLLDSGSPPVDHPIRG